MGWMLLVLWPLEVGRLLFNLTLPGDGAAYLFAAYLLMAVVVANNGNKVLAFFLLLGIALLSLVDGTMGRALLGLQEAMVFAAFVPAVFLLRNLFAQDSRLMEYRGKLERLPPKQQNGMLLVGALTLGSALTVGALAILSPVVPEEAGEARRRAAAFATIFGIALSVLWSPVFVAMAVVSEFMPQIPLWQPILFGLGLALCGCLTALIFLRVPEKGRLTLKALIALRDFVPWVGITAATIVSIRSFTALSTLEAASLTLLPFAGCFMLRQSRATQKMALRSTRRSLDALGAEISIVALAFTLGIVMRDSPSVAELVQGVFSPDISAEILIALIVAAMMLAASLGSHPIVAASVLLAIFSTADSELADLTLCGAVLLGWACSAMVAPAGLILIVASGMFGIDRRKLILSSNTLAVLLFAALGVLSLIVLNTFIA
ncbi:MAG: hypothetical protein ACQETX_09140 [Pseudomonadota bacterium]